MVDWKRTRIYTGDEVYSRWWDQWEGGPQAHYLQPPFPLVPPPPVNLVPGINNGSSSSLPYFTLHIQALKMEQIKCSETSAFNNQRPGKYPKDYTQYSKHGESLKSRILHRVSYQ